MRIVINETVDIPYEEFLFTTLEGVDDNGNKRQFFSATCVHDPKFVIQLKEVHSKEETVELISMLSSAYCNGAKRVKL